MGWWVRYHTNQQLQWYWGRGLTLLKAMLLVYPLLSGYSEVSYRGWTKQSAHICQLHTLSDTLLGYSNCLSFLPSRLAHPTSHPTSHPCLPTLPLGPAHPPASLPGSPTILTHLPLVLAHPPTFLPHLPVSSLLAYLIPALILTHCLVPACLSHPHQLVRICIMVSNIFPCLVIFNLPCTTPTHIIKCSYIELGYDL